MSKKIIISETEKKLIKEMHLLLNENDSSQIQATVKNLSNMFGDLVNDFNNIKSQNQNAKSEIGEQESESDPCAYIKLMIGLYGALISKSLQNIVELNLRLALENDMTKRLELAKLQLEGLTTVLNSMKNLTNLK